MRRSIRRTWRRGRHYLGPYWLAARLRRQGGTGAEIGSWKGDSAEHFLRWAKPSRLTLIDPWRHSEAADHRGAWYARAKGQEGMDRNYEHVLTRFSDEISSGVVVVKRETSQEAAEGWEDAPLDWVYIDGDHTYEAVLGDLERWWQRLRPGGLLTGDDYKRPGWWKESVTEAVDQFAAAHSCRTKALGAQFVIRKPL